MRSIRESLTKEEGKGSYAVVDKATSVALHRRVHHQLTVQRKEAAGNPPLQIPSHTHTHTHTHKIFRPCSLRAMKCRYIHVIYLQFVGNINKLCVVLRQEWVCSRQGGTASLECRPPSAESQPQCTCSRNSRKEIISSSYPLPLSILDAPSISKGHPSEP